MTQPVNVKPAFFRKASRDLFFFFAAMAFAGLAQNMVDSTFNNFLKERFELGDTARTVLELPREAPGFLVAFVSAILLFMGPRRVAFVGFLLQAAGIALVGLVSPVFSVMLVWLFAYSMGQHILLPLNSSLAMELAPPGKEGALLGRVSGLNNAAYIAGGILAAVGFRWLGFSFEVTFVIAAAACLAAAISIFLMTPDKPIPRKGRLFLRKEYGLYYWLSILYGTRKQIFLTFGPWVLVNYFNVRVETMAFLLLIGALIGIGFKPLTGKLIDKLGEKAVLGAEAILLIVICMGYTFSQTLLSPEVSIIVVMVCYVTDQLLMSVGMARATYLKKIARSPGDVTPTLNMGTTIDHVFSIAVALGGGVIMTFFGYQSVFLMGACIAAVNFFSVLRIRLPGKAET